MNAMCPQPDLAVTIETQPLDYHENASKLFAALGGLERDDTVLLESADVPTKQGVNSLMVLAASARLSCLGDNVVVEPLSPSGEKIVARLAGQLARWDITGSADADTCLATITRTLAAGTRVFHFERSTAPDERQRLKDPSSILPLRLVTMLPGYADQNNQLPVIAGGFAYDFIDTFETLTPVPAAHNTFPDYHFVVAEIIATVDHRNHSAHITAIGVDSERHVLHRRVEKLVNAAHISASAVDDCGDMTVDPTAQPLVVSPSISDEQFCRHVETLKESIRVGDIYQAMPSRYFTAHCPDAFAAYQALRATNPSPYMFYLRGVDSTRPFELFGASPESNLKFTAATRHVELYPVAGTLPRGLNPDGSINDELDIRNELQLRTDSKEIAEHTMLVDLARNDLARVAVPATRRVADLMHVDRYSRVMHLVSRVTATLADDVDALDAYRACMNMGTLTGAPKLKATDLNRAVEQCRRGSYGGAVGYLRGTGDMDTAIVIRSAFVTGDTAVVQAGAGVVRDSDPTSEAAESLHKAWAVLHALALAQHTTPKVHRS